MDNYHSLIVLMKGRYKQNPYILQKLEQYILNLPDYLKNIEDEFNKRKNAKEEREKDDGRRAGI